jgi:hypothetical protein
MKRDARIGRSNRTAIQKRGAVFHNGAEYGLFSGPSCSLRTPAQDLSYIPSRQSECTDSFLKIKVNVPLYKPSKKVDGLAVTIVSGPFSEHFFFMGLRIFFSRSL